MNHPLYVLGNPLFDARGANVVHTRTRLVINCPPPTPNPPPFFPNGPLQFTLHVFKDDITSATYTTHIALHMN
jgi:hypothetical protein